MGRGGGQQLGCLLTSSRFLVLTVQLKSPPALAPLQLPVRAHAVQPPAVRRAAGRRGHRPADAGGGAVGVEGLEGLARWKVQQRERAAVLQPTVCPCYVLRPRSFPPALPCCCRSGAWTWRTAPPRCWTSTTSSSTTGAAAPCRPQTWAGAVGCPGGERVRSLAAALEGIRYGHTPSLMRSIMLPLL